MKQIILPHPNKQSRKVTEDDIKTVQKDSIELLRICHEKFHRHHNGATAMVHVQIEADDPLRFFVMNNGEIIINPKIRYKDKSYTHLEGCMSFPFRPDIKVKRFKEIMVSYTKGKVGEAIDLKKETAQQLKDFQAVVFQHEIGHMNLNLIYPR